MNWFIHTDERLSLKVHFSNFPFNIYKIPLKDLGPVRVMVQIDIRKESQQS
jgi:hypothetical protein